MTVLPGANEFPIGEIVGELEDDDVVVGAGDSVVLGGEEELGSWFSGVNNAPGVVIYTGWVIGSADVESWEGSWFGVTPVGGLLLGWEISCHRLGPRV